VRCVSPQGGLSLKEHVQGDIGMPRYRPYVVCLTAASRPLACLVPGL
jgi:hypothetical protein